MQPMFKTGLPLLIVILYSLSGLAQPNLAYQAIPSNFDIDNPNSVMAININYDDIDLEKQIFHLFLPDTLGTYPLVVYIHGGGFDGGNPGTVFTNPQRRGDVKFYLEQGFAYASFGYRLITTPDNEGVIKSLNDSKRALQYVRHFANELNIIPEQVVLTGSSAGAGTAIWLGMRSDMADPDALDPVLQESTRVCAVAASASQSTYDLYKWETQVYQNYDGQGSNYTLDSIANLLTFERASNFYGGIDSLYQIIHDPELIQYRQDVDMLFHMSSDDPPLYFINGSGAVLPSQDLFHHSFHGREINDAALAANLPEVKANIPALSINTTDGESMNDFVVRHLNACAVTTSLTPSIKVKNKEVTIYPNPATTQFAIEWLDEDISVVQIYSLSGKLIKQQNTASSESILLSTSSLRPGIYIVRVTSRKGERVTKKLVVK